MDYEHLTIETRGEALWVTMNRPERLNALNRRLVEELRDLFVGLYWRHEVRVVVLRGAGANFCAGLDLKERDNSGGSGPGNGLIRQRQISEIVIAMRRCPQPIIALVDGAAAGGGFAIALACDVRLATPTLKMNAAFIRIGLSACDIGVSYFLPRMVGSSVAAELMLTGRFIHAERALSLGLVSAVVPDEAMRPEAQKLVDEMLLTTPLGLRLTKECLNHSIDAQGLEAAIAMEDRNQILCAQSE
ncbi:MAG TPA: enoyl-CoA hydratase-related protein, partial [Caulobacteraceae bacterium]|nr:enoyl-CoA hydratase-related protein [Caulobacteraceae bacterium]